MRITTQTPAELRDLADEAAKAGDTESYDKIHDYLTSTLSAHDYLALMAHAD